MILELAFTLEEEVLAMTEQLFPCLKCRKFVDGKPIEGMLFSTQIDLDLHLAAWPGNKAEHQRALKEAREKAEQLQFDLHGGADRVVSQIADIVWSYRAERIRRLRECFR